MSGEKEKSIYRPKPASNLPAPTEKSTSITDDAGSLGDSVMEDMLEMFLPKILPKLQPAFDKLATFLNKGEKMINLQVNPKDGSLHLMIIKSKYLKSFEIEDVEDAYTTYPIHEFLKLLMEGDIESIMKTVEDEFDKESEKH